MKYNILCSVIKFSGATFFEMHFIDWQNKNKYKTKLFGLGQISGFRESRKVILETDMEHNTVSTLKILGMLLLSSLWSLFPSVCPRTAASTAPTSPPPSERRIKRQNCRSGRKRASKSRAESWYRYHPSRSRTPADIISFCLPSPAASRSLRDLANSALEHSSESTPLTLKKNLFRPFGASKGF